MVGNPHKSVDSLVVPITICPNRPLLGRNLINLNK